MSYSDCDDISINLNSDWNVCSETMFQGSWCCFGKIPHGEDPESYTHCESFLGNLRSDISLTNTGLTHKIRDIAPHVAQL